MSKHLPRVAEILSQQSGLDYILINPRTRLVRDLGFDALDLHEVEHELSVEFDVRFELAHCGVNPCVQDLLDQLSVLI